MDMKAGIRIATIRGIPIRIHPTFLIRPPKTPGQEAVMALAGPATSLGLGAVFFALLALVRPLLFAAIGFVSGDVVLLLIAFFVFVWGEAEKGTVLVHSAVSDLRVPRGQRT